MGEAITTALWIHSHILSIQPTHVHFLLHHSCEYHFNIYKFMCLSLFAWIILKATIQYQQKKKSWIILYIKVMRRLDKLVFCKITCKNSEAHLFSCSPPKTFFSLFFLLSGMFRSQTNLNLLITFLLKCPL